MPPPPPPPEFEHGSSSSLPPPPNPVAPAPQAITGWATLGNGQTVELASLGARLGARVLDWAILGACFAATFYVASLSFSATSTGVAKDDIDNLVVIGFLFLLTFGTIFIAYETSMTALKGQTLGKMMTNIKVVRADNGEHVGWGKSIGRWAIPQIPLLFAPAIFYVGFVVSLLVYVSITWDQTRQGWHDKAAGTLVIKT